jgi:hypothetical protein
MLYKLAFRGNTALPCNPKSIDHPTTRWAITSAVYGVLRVEAHLA